MHPLSHWLAGLRLVTSRICPGGPAGLTFSLFHRELLCRQRRSSPPPVAAPRSVPDYSCCKPARRAVELFLRRLQSETRRWSFFLLESVSAPRLASRYSLLSLRTADLRSSQPICIFVEGNRAPVRRTCWFQETAKPPKPRKYDQRDVPRKWSNEDLGLRALFRISFRRRAYSEGLEFPLRGQRSLHRRPALSPSNTHATFADIACLLPRLFACNALPSSSLKKSRRVLTARKQRALKR